MPTDVSQLRAQIDAFAEQFDASRQRRAEVVEELLRPLRPEYARADALVAACLAASRVHDVRWGGALFTQGEEVNRQSALAAMPERYALIATDGSQILPDRHKPFQFAFVQAGCACVTYGSPDQSLSKRLHRLKRSRLISEDELFDENGELKPPSEISNQRDALEVALMAEACRIASDAGHLPVVVADGSIVPFALLGGRNVKQQAGRLLPPIARALDIMRDGGALVCGYIDRPNSNAIAHACAMDGAAYDAVDTRLLKHNDARIAGIADRHLMEIALAPGHRSALFDPAWEVNDLLGAHAMRACYANFGQGTGRAAIIGRIEAPAWCAAQVGTLAAILGRHARLGEGYPLILKAAHEESVISKDDAREIEQAIELALLTRGIVPRPSSKYSAKERA
jgi:hypothetical protein